VNKFQRVAPPILSLLGAGLVIAGISMIYVPAGFIAAGVLATLLAIGIVQHTK
jgi:hypothetical protein